MVRWHLVQRDIKSSAILYIIVSMQSGKQARPQTIPRTLCSEPELIVWARTTLCANLMQHILTDSTAVSHRRKMRCLMDTMRSQVMVSYELFILETRQHRCTE